LVKNHLGFTLLELLLVVALIVIIAAIGTPVYLGHVKNAKITDAKNSLSAIAMKQEQYKINTGGYYISANNTCNNAGSSAVQTALFGNLKGMSTEYWCYYTEVANTSGFIASACDISATSDCYTLDNLNNKSANW